MNQTLIWLLTISHEYDESVCLHQSRADAETALATFCRYWWEHEGLNGDPDALSDEEVIETYFGNVDETYEISAASLPAGYCLTKIEG